MATAAKSNRVTNIQIPGEVDASSVDAKAASSEIEKQEVEGQSDEKTTSAAPAITQSERTLDRPNRRHYAEMSADDIDPTTLTSAVLSRDGWVVPAPKPAGAK